MNVRRMRLGSNRDHGLGLCFSMRVATCAVRTALWLKRFANLIDDEVHRLEQISQHMVRLNFQMVRFKFNRHMPVAQVVSRSGQIKRRAMRFASRDTQNFLRRGYYVDHAAVLSHQHITAAHQRAARQENAELAAKRICAVKAAFLARVPVEFDRGCALDKDWREASALGDDFGD